LYFSKMGKPAPEPYLKGAQLDCRVRPAASNDRKVL